MSSPRVSNLLSNYSKIAEIIEANQILIKSMFDLCRKKKYLQKKAIPRFNNDEVEKIIQNFATIKTNCESLQKDFAADMKDDEDINPNYLQGPENNSKDCDRFKVGNTHFFVGLSYIHTWEFYTRIMNVEVQNQIVKKYQLTREQFFDAKKNAVEYCQEATQAYYFPPENLESKKQNDEVKKTCDQFENIEKLIVNDKNLSPGKEEKSYPLSSSSVNATTASPKKRSGNEEGSTPVKKRKTTGNVLAALQFSSSSAAAATAAVDISMQDQDLTDHKQMSSVTLFADPAAIVTFNFAAEPQLIKLLKTPAGHAAKQGHPLALLKLSEWFLTGVNQGDFILEKNVILARKLFDIVTSPAFAKTRSIHLTAEESIQFTAKVCKQLALLMKEEAAEFTLPMTPSCAMYL